MVEIEEYLRLRDRPEGLPLMVQGWRDLSFLHFSIEPEALRSTVPPELEIDTFPDRDGKECAWVGLVPFWMTGIHFRGLPPITGANTFPETNLRTYVHRQGKEPGVWFYSLEAANQIACVAARKLYGLPYHYSKMNVSKSDGRVEYMSSRIGHQKAVCNVSVDLGVDISPPHPGSLEFFLVERYLLYSKPRGILSTGRVHHSPYGLCKASPVKVEETLTRANDVPQKEWEHFLYSPGVDVDIYPLR